jgi:hypothetical protein
MKWIAVGACVFVTACVTVSWSMEAILAQAPAVAPAGVTAPRAGDVESFRTTIEPIFMRDRGGTMPGYAACVMCHTWQTSLRFALETPATDAGWSADQSRRNFEMITQLVNTRTPENSWLLLKPLEPSAGGLGHTGGTYWKSRQDPEYQAVVNWIRSLPAERYVPAPAPARACSRSSPRRVRATSGARTATVAGRWGLLPFRARAAPAGTTTRRAPHFA